MQFIDVKTDLAFKKVFASEESKDILISFLNAIIYKDKKQQVADLTIVDPYTIPMLKGMKDSFVDVKAMLNDGSRVIIEMQVLNHHGFEKRILYNAAKNYSIQLAKGEDYTLLNPVIALTIVDFTLFEESTDVISRFKMIEKETMIEYSDDIELIFVELPKFNIAFEELNDILQQWIYFVKNAGKMDFIPKNFAPPINKAFSLIDESSMSEQELEAQHRRKEFIFIQKSSLELAEDRGLQKGIEKGIEKNQIETVIKSHKLGIAIQDICMITGLDKKMILAILKKNH